jgi:hypothetical protein
MMLNELDIAYVYVGMLVISKHTNRFGVVKRINYNDLYLKSGIGHCKCHEHDEYHAATIAIQFEGRAFPSTHPQCDYTITEVIK